MSIQQTSTHELKDRYLLAKEALRLRAIEMCPLNVGDEIIFPKRRNSEKVYRVVRFDTRISPSTGNVNTYPIAYPVKKDGTTDTVGPECVWSYDCYLQVSKNFSNVIV